MARTTPRPPPTLTQTLQPIVRHCPCCGDPMWAAYHNYRTITTLEAIMRLTLQIRRCLNPACPQVRKPYRPEAEGRLALPKHEFGLDVLTFIGTQRYAHHSSVPTLHQALVERGMAVAPRTVTNLLERPPYHARPTPAGALAHSGVVGLALGANAGEASEATRVRGQGQAPVRFRPGRLPHLRTRRIAAAPPGGQPPESLQGCDGAVGVVGGPQGVTTAGTMTHDWLQGLREGWGRAGGRTGHRYHLHLSG